jgi:hypothetical protein
MLIQTLEAEVGTAEHYAHAAAMGDEGQGIICNINTIIVMHITTIM